jgi:hypothetical protein
MVGGLLISQLMTLYTTPVVYLYLERLSQFVSGRRRALAGTRPQDQVPAE